MIRVEAEIGGLEAGLAKARRLPTSDPGTTFTMWSPQNSTRRPGQARSDRF